MPNNSVPLLIVMAALSLPIAATHNELSAAAAPDRFTSDAQSTNVTVPSTPDSNVPPAMQDQTNQNQTSNPSAQSSDQDQENATRFPPYRIQVVERTTQAVDYRDRGGTTQVDFRGTPLMPRVTGDAHITGHTGRLAVNVSLRRLSSPRTFGPQYLTYVLWAITPEGRPVNLGEVIPNDDGDSKVQVTTGLQAFGLIVTAEPYFAVTRPSDLVVAENIVRNDTAGGIHPITARYELLQKGQYTVDLRPQDLPATTADKHVPLQLLEAENAIAIARASGAESYAPDTLQKAQNYLNQAQDYYRRKQGITPIGAVSRAAAQTAEDARLMTLEKKQQERTTAERQRAQERIQRAQSNAEANAARAEEARQEAQREADARALAEQERQAAEQSRLQAEQAAQQAAQERAAAQQQLQQAEQARQSALQQQQAYAQQAEQANQARIQTEQQAAQQRQRLLNQLNQVLQTRESARGLIVNMSDVLFDLNRATLKPGAQLRLAKVAGIILAYPDLKLEIDGFTDSTGSPEYNQTLSEKRADSVRDFLVKQGVPNGNIITNGYGESNPVASNATASGRQMNRRVELVVNGAAIGLGNGQGNGAASPGARSAPGSTESPAGASAPGTAGQVNGQTVSPSAAGSGVNNTQPAVNSTTGSSGNTPAATSPTVPSSDTRPTSETNTPPGPAQPPLNPAQTTPGSQVPSSTTPPQPASTPPQ